MRTIRVICALAVITCTVSPSPASATGSLNVMISEVMTGASDNASKEFIELYNSSASATDLTGWSIEYKSATSSDIASNWTKRASLTGAIGLHGFFLVAPKTYYPSADADWSATLASGGGNIRLKDGKGMIVDQLAYGTGNAPETSAALAPVAGQSLERLPGRISEEAGNGQDSDSNALDFILRIDPLPQSSISAVEPSLGQSVSVPETAIEDITQPEAQLIEINELFINPLTPLTDAHDEYIELFNPNDTAVNIGGFQLRNGASFQNSYTLTSTVMAPHAYLALGILQTKLALSNSGGSVRLTTPQGALVDQTEAYDSAPEGQSWSWFDDGWQWTLQPTPGMPNIAVFPVLSDLSAVAQPPLASVKANLKKAAVKSTPKPKVVKTPVPKKTTRAKASVKFKASKPVKVAAAKVATASWLLISLIVLTIGYAIYEFRHDLRNYYYIIKRNFRTGRKAESSAEGRGDD